MRYFLFVLLLLQLSALIEPVFAQEIKNATLTVSPSVVRLDLKESEPTFELTYKNGTRDFLELALKAQDFSALEDGQRIKFFDDPKESSYRYSLASWVTFEQNTIGLQPNEEKKVKVLVDQSRLSPGGHYASLIAEINQKPAQGNVSLKGSLASLVFVRTAQGLEREQAEVSAFTCYNSWLRFPTTCTIRFNNTGNVELTPYGRVDIFKLNQAISKGILNESSLITLPESFRTYSFSSFSLPPVLLPGLYTVKATLHYGTREQKVIYKEFSFFSFGSTWVLVSECATILALVWLSYLSISRFRKHW